MEAGEYRRRARRCLAQAQLVSNPEARARIIDTATIWMFFAERAERNHRPAAANPAQEAGRLGRPLIGTFSSERRSERG